MVQQQVDVAPALPAQHVGSLEHHERRPQPATAPLNPQTLATASVDMMLWGAASWREHDLLLLRLCFTSSYVAREPGRLIAANRHGFRVHLTVNGLLDLGKQDCMLAKG